ncbi:hypothetical protein AV530_007686 [Patagioenas fasciata monilis]|uniref:Uncharacterized protein n=1 Tax=Patagioenas fasciata monilis TaxID=372326 RepID=A0A1V4JYU3_PATFA|nr:hypothetical protein AV530_007686 [Patagioenas fasciata monilis]
MTHRKCDSAELQNPEKIMKIHEELIKRRGSMKDIPEEAVSVGEFLLQARTVVASNQHIDLHWPSNAGFQLWLLEMKEVHHNKISLKH